MIRRSHLMLFFVSAVVLSSVAAAQTYHVDLPRLTTLDNWGVHLTLRSSSPKEKLIIPSIDTTGARFFEVFYSWKIKDDPHISVMLTLSQDGEKLYIDANNNEDLTDDGSPFFFPNEHNDFTFDIVSRDDSLQRVKILLQRKPNLPDSLVEHYVDNDRNLNPRFASLWGSLKSNPSYRGERGAFYFDDRITVRRGVLGVGQQHYEIGLFDFSNNGLFNDDDDVLLVDLNRDGKLTYPDEALALNDVFSLAGVNLKISLLDKYGSWFDAVTTDVPPTSFLLKKLEEESAGGLARGVVDQAIWDVTASSIDGTTLALSSYKGKYLLLNFWGEWCQPCIAEIPALLHANSTYGPRNLQIVSFLKSADLHKANLLIIEKGMTWPQLILSDALEDRFDIGGYPTNILILPDGKQYVRTSHISTTFFESHLR